MRYIVLTLTLLSSAYASAYVSYSTVYTPRVSLFSDVEREFWNHRVQKGDTYTKISKKIESWTTEHCMAQNQLPQWLEFVNQRSHREN